MERRVQGPRERASVEAADWFILLEEEAADPGLRRRFEAWLDADPENAAAWAATEHTLGVVDLALPADAARRRSAIPLRRLAARRGRVAGFAGLALAACLALAVLPDLWLHLRADHQTGTARTDSVTLADGSTVVLAPDSAIAVAYANGARRIELLSGEAFFDVVPDAARPFLVVAGDVRTTVLGTRFDVRRDGDGAVVVVEHGSVRVERSDASPPVAARLASGEAVAMRSTGEVDRWQIAPQRAAPWREGLLIAEDEPMGRVIDQLRRYYAGTIVLADSRLSGRPVTGIYRLSDPVDAVRAVARAHGATVREITPWMIVITGF